MTIAEQKAAQRKAGIAARRALSEADRTSANAALCARIAGLDCFRTAQNILLYAAFGGEADLSALAGQAAAQGKTLAWPVCGEGFSLTAAVPEADGWEVGAYGIRTPVLRRSALLRPDQLDLVLVPCTAFDAACRRVLDFARTQPALLKRVEDTGKLPMGELSAGSGTDRKTMERHRKYLVALLLAFTNGFEIIRGHLRQMARPVKEVK